MNHSLRQARAAGAAKLQFDRDGYPVVIKYDSSEDEEISSVCAKFGKVNTELNERIIGPSVQDAFSFSPGEGGTVATIPPLQGQKWFIPPLQGKTWLPGGAG